MKLIARQNIIGITDDDGLRALDGIKFYESDANSANELITQFEKENPDFGNCNYQIIKETNEKK